MKPRFICLLTLVPALLFAAGDMRVAEAVRKEDKALLRKLILQKADVNAAGVDGTTALHGAVEYDDVDAADLLVKSGARVDAKDRYGLTPIYYAVSNGNLALVERLLDAGANPNGADAEGDSLLMISVRGTGIGLTQADRKSVV